jgi:flagellin
MNAKTLGLLNVSVKTQDSSRYSIERVALALARVSEQRSELGSYQNRLEHTIKNLDNVVENTTASESQIRDTDMATELVKFYNTNILKQVGQSMLAQANQTNQGVLSLLS